MFHVYACFAALRNRYAGHEAMMLQKLYSRTNRPTRQYTSHHISESTAPRLEARGTGWRAAAVLSVCCVRVLGLEVTVPVNRAEGCLSQGKGTGGRAAAKQTLWQRPSPCCGSAMHDDGSSNLKACRVSVARVSPPCTGSAALPRSQELLRWGCPMQAATAIHQHALLIGHKRSM